MSNRMVKNRRCCSGNSPCCEPEPAATGPAESGSGKRRLEIDLLYLDLSICTRCKGAEDSLEEALAEVARVLEATGVEVSVRKIHIQDEEQARTHRFISSPTIRVNGRDIQLDVKESLCESCGDLCGDDVDCRVWVYQGKEYTSPPKAMIVDAILRAVYGGHDGDSEVEPEAYDVPLNLQKFFAAKRAKRSGQPPDSQASSKTV